jgi:hypothetical protein
MLVVAGSCRCHPDIEGLGCVLAGFRQADCPFETASRFCLDQIEDQLEIEHFFGRAKFARAGGFDSRW